jgi:hypothetical protein
LREGERIESGHLEIALRKRRGRKEQRRKEVGDRNKTVNFLFFGIAVLCLKKNVIKNRKAGFLPFQNLTQHCNSSFLF